MLCATCNLRKGAKVDGDAPRVPVISELVIAASSAHQPVPATVPEVLNVVEHLNGGGDNDTVFALVWALDAHPDTPSELRTALAESLRPLPHEDARLFWLLQQPIVSVRELTEIADSGETETSARAAAMASILLLEDDTEALRYARQAREKSTDLAVQATAAFAIAALTDDDVEWPVELQFAYDHGNSWVKSQAAILFGTATDHDAAAYTFLEEATRSPYRELAANAADELARRFADEPEIAERYATMKQSLEEPRHKKHPSADRRNGPS